MHSSNTILSNYIIAIDGYSACGKSTLAKDLAKSLQYVFIDSGAMYRAVTLYAIENNIDFDDLKLHFNHIDISFQVENEINTIYLNGKNVRLDIRSKAVNEHVSLVAKIPEVRRFLVEKQQSYGSSGGIVMDGRDIGTVVFPNADLKFFVVADIKVRTIRRATEMAEIGRELPESVIEQNLLDRDHIDSTRKDSPLKQAEDAILIDNTHLTKKEQLDLCCQFVTALNRKRSL